MGDELKDRMRGLWKLEQSKKSKRYVVGIICLVT